MLTFCGVFVFLKLDPECAFYMTQKKEMPSSYLAKKNTPKNYVVNVKEKGILLKCWITLKWIQYKFQGIRILTYPEGFAFQRWHLYLKTDKTVKRKAN